MLKLASVIYAVAGSTLAGTFMIIALVMGYDDAQGVVISVAIGFAVGLPVSWIITKKLNPEGKW